MDDDSCTRIATKLEVKKKLARPRNRWKDSVKEIKYEALK
jgi:hypothetical protein